MAGAWALLCGAALVAGSGCRRDDGADAAEGAVVLARVAGEALTAQDFVDELQRRSGRARVDYGSGAAREHVLGEMIDRRAALARARALGLEADPRVQRDVEAVLLRHLRARELDAALAGVAASDDAIAAYYEAHADDFARPARVRAAIVQLATPRTASPEARARRRVQAEAMLEEARSLAPGFHGFGPIAARASDHRASRYKGGDVGWLVRDERRYAFDAAVLDAIYALESPGELGPVVEGEDGYYLVRLVAAEPRELAPLARVEPQIRQRVLEAERQRVHDEWIAGLRARADIEVDADALMGVPAPAELAATREPERPRPPRLPGS